MGSTEVVDHGYPKDWDHKKREDIAPYIKTLCDHWFPGFIKQNPWKKEYQKVQNEKKVEIYEQFNSGFRTIENNGDDFCAKQTYELVNSIQSFGGCMDESSINYNPYASYDDGSCGQGECHEEQINNYKEYKNNQIFFK